MSGAGSRGLYLDPPQNAAVVSVDEKSHLLLQVRTRVLNDQLASDFHRWYSSCGISPDWQVADRACPYMQMGLKKPRPRCPYDDPQPDTRTIGHAATATCEGAVSYDLSGECLTERGLSGRPDPAPGQDPAEPPQVRGISVGFSASTTGT